jgi:tRNA-dihydrouridine synthase B
MITVHGRTREQGFSGASDRSIIGKTRAALPSEIPLIGNGDVITVDDYFRMREETGCDGVMIGRGAMGNPWLFRDIAARLRGDSAPSSVDVAERTRVFARHMDLIGEHLLRQPAVDPRKSQRGDKRLLHELRKAVAWYTKGLRDSSQVRERAFHVEDPAEVRRIGIDYFAHIQHTQRHLRDVNSPSTMIDKADLEVA